MEARFAAAEQSAEHGSGGGPAGTGATESRLEPRLPGGLPPKVVEPLVERSAIGGGTLRVATAAYGFFTLLCIGVAALGLPFWLQLSALLLMMLVGIAGGIAVIAERRLDRS